MTVSVRDSYFYELYKIFKIEVLENENGESQIGLIFVLLPRLLKFFVLKLMCPFLGNFIFQKLTFLNRLNKEKKDIVKTTYFKYCWM